MRTAQSLSSMAIVLALAGAGLAQQRPSSYKNLKYPPLNRIQPPEPARFELPNGMVVYLVEDHELPTVSVTALIRAGSRWEPADKAGLASITGTVMRTGGSTSRSGDQLDEELDRLAAVVETGIGEDSGRAMVSVLKEDLDKGLAILADILQHPAFPQDKIDLAKIAQRDSIARRNDNPQGIAMREFRSIMFGKNSPYARQTEYASIDAITRDDLVAFHRHSFQPENIILGAWGDFSTADMRARIEKTLGAWPRGSQPKPPVPAVDDTSRAGFYSINKDDMSQSWVVMGLLGGRRDDPDFYALTVMNEVLGGGLSSRLFSNVRSDQGLAYAVSSNWGAGWDRRGTFTVLGSSKPETTVKIYHSMRHEVERMAEGGATDDELARAKDGILKGFAFEFDSTSKIVSRLMSYEYYGYPRDYLQRYRDNIDKVGRSDVARVAKQYLKPDQFAVLFLGKEKGYELPLASLGKVTPVDITIPQPKQAALAAATPQSIAQGKALLAAAREAMGGAALARVKDYTTTSDLVVDTPQGQMSLKMESTVNPGGKWLQKMTTPMGEVTTAYDGQSAWMKMGAQTRDLPSSQATDLRGGIFHDTIHLLQNIDNPAYTVQAIGPAEVAISDPEHKLQVKLVLDPQTKLPAKKTYTAALMGAPGEVEEVYSDYRDTEGLKLPYKTVMNRSGKKVAEQTVSQVKLNPGIEDSAYKKP